MPIPRKLPRSRTLSAQGPESAKTTVPADGSRTGGDDDSPLPPPPPVQFTSEQPNGPSVQTPSSISIRSAGLQSVPSTPAAAPASQAPLAREESHIDRVKRLLEQNRRILGSSQKSLVSADSLLLASRSQSPVSVDRRLALVSTGQNSQPHSTEAVSVPLYASIERVESNPPPPGRGGDDGYRDGKVASDGNEVVKAAEQQQQAREEERERREREREKREEFIR